MSTDVRPTRRTASDGRRRKARARVHLLDVGDGQYGDCIFCEIGHRKILIDGGHRKDLKGSAGHPSIPSQLSQLMGGGDHVHVDLIVVSHAHDDHVGCIPEMVESEFLSADYALLVSPDQAWGGADDDALPVQARRLQASIREEPRTDLTLDSFLEFAADALGLQARYRTLIDNLRAGGAEVIQLGEDDDAGQRLEEIFGDIGFEFFGPAPEHVRAAAAEIHGEGRDFMQQVSDAVATDRSAFEHYQVFAQAAADQADAWKGIGPAINSQSSIFGLLANGHKLLFTGDMQFEKPEVQADDLEAHVYALRDKVAASGPYSFLKVGHHGSYNSFGEDFVAALGGAKYFGICTGAGSLHHPSGEAIRVLSDTQGARWARTDVNGPVTFNFEGARPKIEVTKGELNDTSLPGDVLEQAPPTPIAVQPAAPPPPPPAISSETRTVLVPASGEAAPIEIRIPYLPGVGVEVQLSLRVVPVAPTQSVTAQGGSPKSDSRCNLGGGRQLPKLLFVTNRGALEQKIGRAATEEILRDIANKGHYIEDAVPLQGGAERGARAVSNRLRTTTDAKGVVILGGYDVVEPLRVDALPPELRAKVETEADLDNFTVWSDAAFGDNDGDGIQEVPVSRIPDGGSADLMFRALSAAPKSSGFSSRDGVRNFARQFADVIYQSHLQGPSPMRVSHPQRHDQPAYQLSGDHVYIMLHGDYRNARSYWGEDARKEYVEAVNIANVPEQSGSVVFTGCCWGALGTDQLARDVPPGTKPRALKLGESIALQFLRNGAVAFIGCTGVHYSPTVPPFRSSGGPMHRAFWDRLLLGKYPPAEALLRAKAMYLAGIPYIANSDTAHAVERKIYEQYTCLGLGW